MSGITRSTPSNSDSGNIIPASTTKISSPNRNAIMFIPNSPSPPRGITVSDCLLLLKKGFSPQPNLESYHTAACGTGTPACAPGFLLPFFSPCPLPSDLCTLGVDSFPSSPQSLLYFHSPERTPTRGTPPP